MFNRALCIFTILASAAIAGDVNDNYLHPKAYVEYPARSGSAEFNTSGRPVRYEVVSTSTVRIVFEDLDKFVVRPHVQIGTRAFGSKLQQTCGARLETTGRDLVAIVHCMVGTQPSSPEVTLLIVDETTDAGYMTLTRCVGSSQEYGGCGPEHNPFSSALYPIRVSPMPNGRWQVFFKMNDPQAFWVSPIALVTPVSGQVACEVFSVGSKYQRSDEFGVEVDCRPTGGQGFSGTTPTPAIDTRFHLLVIPRSARTGYMMSDPNGKSMFATNNHGQLQTTKLSTGRYRVLFKSLSYDWPDNGIVLVESHGAGLEGCSLTNMQRVSAYDLELDVTCRKLNGDVVDSAFSLIGTSRH